MEAVSGDFERCSRRAPEADEEQVKDLHVRIGEWGLTNDFWPESLNPGPASEAQDDKTKPAEPVRRQAMPLLPISRSSFYR
tara:strand:+ start:10923 stop:11165 length:243 start_codon:yes stop_codon:yes gene_type:complete